MSFSPRMEAFRVSTRAIGIDLMRSQYTRNLGTYVAAPLATFRAGMLVQLNASQEVEACGTGGVMNPFGFAKYTKDTVLYAAVVGERITLTGVAATNLKHANLLAPGGTSDGVRVVVVASGAVAIEGTDYTANYVNGQITRIVTSVTIPSGAVVAVDYSYQVTEAELQYEGRNFWNFNNDVDIQGGKIAVITDWSIIFTTQYDPSRTYAVNDKLYAGSSADGLAGLVSNDSHALARPYIGRVFQVPTADDPYLGVQFVGGGQA